ncbi:DUF1800 domain-containing protein [Pararoseomonas sp. SCSIO 73927]|uniref:DUF1800 domain-containing protein n=1 Tax=Pararoseomonas sp. SCSIO 73927 TaxID=3114537 RepID=UPI0030D3EA72
MSAPDMLSAVNRFGLGAAPGELARARPDPRGYVAAQIATAPAPPALPETVPADTAAGLFLLTERRRILNERNALVRRGEPDPGTPFTRPGAVAAQELALLLSTAAETRAPLAERLALHWSDHFTTSGGFTGFLAGSMEREAIRPHMLGNFRDMLVGVTLHPAMLFYLDNRNSVGPNSALNRASRRPRGLNENLGREVLELHTLGVDGGYTQEDVIALARILTGWSIDLGEPPRRPERVGFFPDRHEPGPKTLLGKTYETDGPGQIVAALSDLARHPATARHVTRRLVRHFVGEGLPALEARMAEVYRRTDGDLRAVTRALVSDDEAWGPPRKVRPPVELLLAAARLFGGLPRQPDPGRALQAMGQPFWGAPAPKGWPAENDAWAAPDAIKTRLDWASELSARLPPGTDARAVLETALGSAASAETRRAVERAADGRQAITLLLLSPEFQRR